MVELNPFRSWVPKPLGVLIYILLLIPCLTVGGVYGSITSEIVGLRGIQSDDVQMATYCLTIGMAAFGPFMARVARINRHRALILICFSILILLSLVVRQTEEQLILWVCSICIGFFRMMALIICLLGMLSYITGKNMGMMLEHSKERTEAEWKKTMYMLSAGMTLIYLFCLSIAQAGTSLTAWIAEYMSSQSVYNCMILWMAVMMSVVIILEPRHSFDDLPQAPKGDTHWPFTAGRMLSALLMTISMASFAFMASHGYNMDWFSARPIRIAAASCLFFLGAFLLSDLVREPKNRYFDYELFSLPATRWSLLLFVVMMLINSSTLLTSVCTQMTVRLDQWQSACLNMWGWIGYLIASLFIFFTFKFLNYRYYWTLAFCCFAVYAAGIYLGVQNQMLYNDLRYLIVIRSIGMFTIYSTVMVLSFYHRPAEWLPSWSLAMLVLRNVFAPAVGVALYQQGLLNGQQEYLQVHALAYNSTTIVQGTLAAVKELAGYTLWAVIAVILFLMFYQWKWLDGDKQETKA
jgi:hypothetical protein